jgi:hypothetical protein
MDKIKTYGLKDEYRPKMIRSVFKEIVGRDMTDEEYSEYLKFFEDAKERENLYSWIKLKFNIVQT